MCEYYVVTVWKCTSIINALSYFVSCQQHLKSFVSLPLSAKAL